MKILLVLLILGVSNSLSYVDKSSQKTNNGTPVMKSMNLAKQTDPNDQTQRNERQTSSFQSQQNYKNDDDHLHQSLLSSLNSKIPHVDPSAAKISTSKTQQSFSLVSNRTESKPPNQNQGQIPTNSNFKPSQFIGYQNSKPVSRQNVITQQQQRAGVHSGLFQPIYASRKNGVGAQRRNDEDMNESYMEGEGEEGQYEQMEGTNQDEDDSYSPQKTETHEHQEYGVPKPEYEIPNSGYEDPETRQSPFDQGIPPSGPSFAGLGSFDPLPPGPPPPIKGSVDYILIPLILIGLAGPIFVVLYVILGAFEAKLSPIVGRSMSYKPYLDTLTSSVSRALDKNDCYEYVACQVGSFANRLGYTDDQLLKDTMKPLTPTKYRRSMRTLFSSMKQPGECSLKSCLTF